MAEPRRYDYTPICDVETCDQPAVYKVAAPWNDGSGNWSELKNYGVYCKEHSQGRLEMAQEKLKGLRLARGETVGEVRLYQLGEGRRDSELIPVS